MILEYSRYVSKSTCKMIIVLAVKRASIISMAIVKYVGIKMREEEDKEVTRVC